MRRSSDDVFEPLEKDRVPDPWPPRFSPEQVIAALEPLVLEARRERLLSVFAARLESVTVLMDAPHDPHNGAAVLRSCDAFGVQTLHVVPRDERFILSHRVTRGTERWVDVVIHPGPQQAAAALSASGYRLVATHPEGRLEPAALSRMERLALVLGNERDGVSDALFSAAHDTVRVPMRGFVESLNVSVTAAILLFAATNGRAGDLPDTTRRRLYARGLYQTVPRADEVLDARNNGGAASDDAK